MSSEVLRRIGASVAGMGLLTLLISACLGELTPWGPVPSRTPRASSVRALDSVNFTNGELLGRPTDTSVTVKMMADEDLDIYFEFGVQTGVYSDRTTTARRG